MADYIIVFRTPNNHVGFVTDEKDEVAVFKGLEAAQDVALHVPVLRVLPYVFVNVDELFDPESTK